MFDALLLLLVMAASEGMNEDTALGDKPSDTSVAAKFVLTICAASAAATAVVAVLMKVAAIAAHIGHAVHCPCTDIKPTAQVAFVAGNVDTHSPVDDGTSALKAQALLSSQRLLHCGIVNRQTPCKHCVPKLHAGAQMAAAVIAATAGTHMLEVRVLLHSKFAGQSSCDEHE